MRTWLAATLVLAVLGSSALALALVPLLMPSSYSWIANTTSEAGAQGIDGAWLARLGLLLFGLAIIGLTTFARDRFGAWGAAMHYLFGACLAATAAFSTRPWTGAPFDMTEDLLHSIAATTMGFAFAAGVVLTWMRRGRHAGRARVYDAVAVLASVVLPIGMSVAPDVAGLLQRLMFVIAYAWYVAVAIGVTRRGSTRPGGLITT